MAAIASLRTTLSTLRTRPILFLGGFLLAVVVLPQAALQIAGVPILPALLSILTFFVTPFLVAGLYGMAAESLVSGTSLGRLVEVGKDRYVPLLIGNLLEFVVYVAFWLVGGVLLVAVVFVVGVGVTASGAAPVPGLAPGAVGLAGLAGGILALGVPLLGTLVVRFFVQFFPAAIVVDEAGAVEGFKVSAGVVRSNLASALGYSAITVAAGLLVWLPTAAYVGIRFLERANGAVMSAGGMGTVLSSSEIAGLALSTLVLETLVGTFTITYATAFYTRVQGSR